MNKEDNFLTFCCFIGVIVIAAIMLGIPVLATLSMVFCWGIRIQGFLVILTAIDFLSIIAMIILLLSH